MDNYKFGEPWRQADFAKELVKNCEDQGISIFSTSLMDRMLACVNFCAGVDVPEVTGGLRELLGKAKKVCFMPQDSIDVDNWQVFVEELLEVLAQFEKGDKE